MHGGAVRRHDEPVDHDVVPRPPVGHEVAAKQGIERPRPDDVVALRPHRHRIEVLELLVVPLPECVVQRADARVHPGVEHVRMSDQFAAARGALVHRRLVDRGIDIALRLLGRNDRPAVLAVPHRDGGGEVPLARYDPVPLQRVDPVLQADLHERRMPLHLVGELQHLLLVVHGLQEPLGHLQELDGVMTAPASSDVLLGVLLLDHQAGGLEILDDGLLALLDGHALILAGQRRQPALLVDGLVHRQVVLHHPFQVGLVADGAYHHHSGAELRVDLVVSDDLDCLAVDRSDELLSDQVFLALVLRRDGHHLAGGQQLWPGGGDDDVLVGAFELELDVVELGDVVRVLHLGVGQCGGAGRAPVHREGALVHEPFFQQPQERYLGDSPVVRRVGLIVHRGVHGLAELLELLGHLIDEGVCELRAQSDILLPWSGELGDAVLLLHLDLGRGPIDVEA